MAAYVSSVSGNFNDPATWGGVGVPTAVDTFEITGGITVTVPAGYSAAGIPTLTGTNSTTRAKFVIAPDGTYTMGGSLALGITHHLVVNGTLDLAGFSLSGDANTNKFWLEVTGTAAKRAKVISNGSIGKDLVFTTQYNSSDLVIAYADFVGLGDIQLPSSPQSNSTLFTITNTVFKNCRNITLGGFAETTSDWIIDGVDVRDSRASGTMLTVIRGGAGAPRPGSPPAGNPSRLNRVTIDGSATADRVRWQVDNLGKTQIIYRNAVSTSADAENSTVGNSFVGWIGTDPTTELEGGSLNLFSDGYIFVNADNPHTGVNTRSFDNCVIEATYSKAFTDHGDHFIVGAGNGSFTNSLILEGKSGVLANALGSLRSGNYDVSHNTLVGNYNGVYGALARTEGGGLFGGGLSLQSNLVVNISGNPIARGLNFDPGDDQIGLMDFNAWYDFNTRYSGVTSATKTPGVTVGYGGNDLVLASLPTFTDSTRNLATFGQAFLGTMTAEEAVDAFMTINGYDPVTGSQTGTVLSVQPMDVTSWVKQGWTVSNATLVNAGHDAQNIGILDVAIQATTITSGATTWTIGGTAGALGQYATGDNWIVGSSSVTAIGGANGSMINIAANIGTAQQGFDSRISALTGDVSGSLPVTIQPDSMLVTARSYTSTELTNKGYGALDPVIAEHQLLTVITSAPAAGAFRPPMFQPSQPLAVNVSDIDVTKLPNLKKPNGAANVPEWESIRFAMSSPRVWIAGKSSDRLIHSDVAYKNLMAPAQAGNYGREVSKSLEFICLSLLLDYPAPEKLELLKKLVQHAIDIVGFFKAGGVFQAEGADNMGRKAVLIIAAKVTGNTEFLQYLNGSLEKFQEDQQAFYVTDSDVTRTNGPSWAATGTFKAKYRTSDIGKAAWGVSHENEPLKDNKHWRSEFRHASFGAMAGTALTAHILGLKTTCNNPAFFDYMDAHVAREPIQRTIYNDPTNAVSLFVMDMWNTYRHTGASS